ncbi:ChaC-like protein-domain-containing protein [Pelagophyceae sp. CCMP2097]|nr:ChaC-like protein-domain-containing protein [Pelagophyceae sp. CCMP2097]
MAATWDAGAGVYTGGRAESAADFEVPDPLWIFGYGSLVWRPEVEWVAFEQRAGVCDGWARYFAQQSTDHRGTPNAPGLVATLLEEPGASTKGTAYKVPDDCVASVLDKLDVRERGGYTRRIASVDLVCADGGPPRRVSALVYSATRENPNFVPDLASTESAAVAAAAEIIATAVGPSGRNYEYLEELAAALPDDAYLAELNRRARDILAAF